LCVDCSKTSHHSAIYHPRVPTTATSHITTTDGASRVPQHGSSFTAARTGSVAKDDVSFASHHCSSSHFGNVQSFTTIASAEVSATPFEDQCSNATSHDSLNRGEQTGSKRARVVNTNGQSALPDFPDTLGPTLAVTPLGASAQLTDVDMGTPPLHDEQQNSPNVGTSGLKMQTPAHQSTGPDSRDFHQSTPVLGHDPHLERSFSSQGATKDEDSIMP